MLNIETLAAHERLERWTEGKKTVVFPFHVARWTNTTTVQQINMNRESHHGRAGHRSVFVHRYMHLVHRSVVVYFYIH